MTVVGKTPSDTDDDPLIVVTKKMILDVGGDAAAAVVFARIRWQCQLSGDGWWTAPHPQLSAETGLSVGKIQRALAKLRKLDLIVAAHRETCRLDQRLSFAVVDLSS